MVEGRDWVKFFLTNSLIRFTINLAMKGKVFNKDREFAVILEKIHSDIKIIVEDLTAVKKRVNAIFEEQGREKEDIFIIKTDIRIIKADIAEIKTTLKGHSERLSHLEATK
jgi:peptidoglycan hydrolase CwlO-like protein